MKSKIYRFLLLLILGVIVTSCSFNKDEDLAQHATETPTGTYVLHKRDPRLITKLSRTRHQLRALGMEDEQQSSPLQYLGRGYKVGDGIIGHPTNLTYPILERDKILKDPEFKDYIQFDKLGYASTRLQTSTELESRMEEELETKKINSGFFLNLGLFSLGAKTSYTKTFHSFQLQDKSHAKGRLDLLWYETLTRLASSTFILDKIGYTYLKKSFIEGLYYGTISDLINQYGTFVVMGYYTGGRATNQYLFETTNSVDKKSWHQDINSFVGATYSWTPRSKKDNTDSADTTKSKGNSIGLYLGVRNTNGKDIANEFHCEKAFRQTTIFGGAREHAYAAPPQKAGQGFIDLGPWFQSLTDEKSHKLIDIADNGLIGIDKFILERNFKYRMKHTLTGETQQRERLVLPYIQIQYAENKAVYGCSGFCSAGGAGIAALYTRQGDVVLLVDKNFEQRTESDEDEQYTYDQTVKELDKLYSPVFKCDIKVTRGIKPSFEKDTMEPLMFRSYFDFSSTSIYKYKNPNSNIWYIYDKSTKWAFSYYDDDEILELYGLDEWVEKLPERKISMKSLASSYKIIGL